MGELSGKYIDSLAEASIIGIIVSYRHLWDLQELLSTNRRIDISKYIENSTIIMPSVIRARVTSNLFLLALFQVAFYAFWYYASGRAIFKRDTARLFNELEV